MTLAAPLDVLVLFAEALAVGCLILGLHHLRSRLGLAPLYVVVGAFQLAQVILAATLYVNIGGGLMLSPGSVILFPAGLLAVILIYIDEDAAEARKLVYGLLIANLALGTLLISMGWHLGRPGTVNLLNLPGEAFAAWPHSLITGTLIFWVDALLVILLFEATGRLFGGSVFARSFLALTPVLALDTLLFATANMASSPDYATILTSGVVSKSATAVVFSGALAVYLRATHDTLPGGKSELRDLFQVLTYRERFEQLQQQVLHDPVSGVYNRAFLDDFLPLELERAGSRGKPASLLMLDVDDFKQINDRLGHSEGDRVLETIGLALADGVRSYDAVCRYGGDEFCIVLPGASASDAEALAWELLDQITTLPMSLPSSPVRLLSVTIGVATFPEDGAEASTLLDAADRRLYAGKRAGRTRVVGPRDRVN